MNLRKSILAAIAWLTLLSCAFAQSIGGNASISATGASANVALPGNTQTYPSAIIAPAYGAATEVFYALGTSNSVAAVTTGPALPSGGICVNVGPNSYIAAITGGTAATVRITQLSTCANFSGSGGGSSSGSSTANQGTPASAANAWPEIITDYGGVNQAGVNSSHQLAVQNPPGKSGAITQSSVSVTNASSSLLTASQFANFEKICVPFTATTGVWVNWSGVPAVAAAPAEYMPPGQCDTWIAVSGYMPTAAAFAISNSASTIAVVVEGN